MESDSGPMTQTDSNANKLPRCKPPVPKKPSISQKPGNLSRSPSASANQDTNPQKVPPPLPNTPPNCGLRKAKSPPNGCTDPSTSQHLSSNNHAPPNDNSISSTPQTTINGSIDQSNSFSQNIDQSHLTNSTCHLNQNTTASNEDLTSFSKTQNYTISPKPRLPRTSSNPSMNRNHSAKSSNSNSPNVVKKSKPCISKSTFYDDETDSVDTQVGQSCFYIASEALSCIGSSSKQLLNQDCGPGASSVGNSNSEISTHPQSRLSEEGNSSTKSTKKVVKIPPKVPPKVSPKRVGSQKDISAAVDSQPKFVLNSEISSRSVDSGAKDNLTLTSGKGSECDLALKVEVETSLQAVHGNSENAKLQTRPRNLCGDKTPSPRPRPQPKPRKRLTPSPRKRSETSEEEGKSGASDSKEISSEKGTESSLPVVDEVKDSTKGDVEKSRDGVSGKVEQKVPIEFTEEVKDSGKQSLESEEENQQKCANKTEKDSEIITSKEDEMDQNNIVCDTKNFKEIDEGECSQGNTKPGLDLTKIASQVTGDVLSDESASQKLLSPIAEDKTIVVKDVEKDSRKVVDVLSEEDIPETSSLLDEIEKIVTKRMSSLESSSQDIADVKNSELPVRPPRPKRESRRKSSIGEVPFDYSNSNQVGSESIDSSAGDMAAPPSGKKMQPPKPKRHKINKNIISRSQSDVSGVRPHGLEVCNSVDNSEDELEKNNPVLPPRKTHGKSGGKGRSLTVDFCVPANQHALLREIALADHRRDLETSSSPESQKSSQSTESTDTSLQSTKRHLRPSRKAPPPPPSSSPTPTSTKTDTKNSLEDISHPQRTSANFAHQSSFSAPTLSDEDSGSIDTHEYHYIPEDLINPPSDSTLHKEKSPSPPDLPPRTYSTNLSTSTSVIGHEGLSDSCLLDKDRPVSVVSVFSSQSESGSFGHGSPENDELSSDDSEIENEKDKVARKRAKKVFCIAKEICSSEEVFVDVLTLLNVDFRVFVSQATEASGKPVIPNEVLNKILNYLPQLQNLNEELLKDLQTRVAQWEEFPQVADIFIKKGPFLKLYTSYIKDFSEANEILDEACKRHPSFLTAIKQFERSPRCANLALKHYMLKPIQRIPQYKLLLQDYRKHLTTESPDYSNTLAALKIVSDVADHANESMRQGDHVQKMLEIQKSVEGNYEVIKPGRTFLKEGELMKLSRKEMQPRMFFLFNDVLLYTTPIATGGYRFNNALTLVGMKVSKPKRDDLKTEFNIISIQRSFMVVSKSQADRDSWVDKLQRAIDDQAHRRNTFENGKTGGQSFYDIYDVNYELGSKAPIWIPDTRVTMCMICTSEFSVTWRRHHCRACGRVVCSSCSDNRAPLEYLRNKSVRVCNECFQKLKEAVEEKEKHHGIDDKFTQGQDGAFLSLGNLKERFRQIRRSARFTHQPTTRRPSRLKIHASDPDATISGYLFKWHKDKKWKKFWFLMKDNVLYTFKASEDVNATDSVSVVGYDIGEYSKVFEGVPANLLFDMKHKNQPPIIFHSEDEATSQRWLRAMEEASQLKT
ncbi:FYVE, RhoGEF and PH domain-containing protein 6-like isoform X3 [Ostrea edulis]|uniref:FYVE, RhoGEF and PH domain-containing protein 6-like isoform X3 n=2 Tax=Ostrea edulis TaxID=37623 RepID=UPI0024AECE3B|nr:FYVE, RhoGEF and PH domain-containing protein 6-like isoform X3 [Ostrea edulis]